MKSLVERYYPEVGAGGYSRRSGTFEFYHRVNHLLPSNATVLNVGAGRGHIKSENSRRLQDFRGRASRVIGIDIDPAIAENALLDSYFVVGAAEGWPVPEESVDIVLSDWTLEHVADSKFFAQEVRRVLRPGGWFVARTPNKAGYIASAARLVPNSLHVSALRRLQPRRDVIDVFPTVYDMNTNRRLHELFPSSGFEHCSYYHDSEPNYGEHFLPVWLLAELLMHLSPPRFRSTLMVFIRKKP